MDNKKPISITLYLMTQKGFDVINSIIQNKLNPLISEVIVGRDKKVDKDYATEIISICNTNNIKVYERGNVPDLKSDYTMTISWRWLIPKTNSKLIVFHDSLLPKYRGFSPLVNMLINMESEIGVSAIFANKEYDKGDIIAQSSIPISYPIKIADAINLISKIYIQLTLDIFSQLQLNKPLSSTPQNEELSTYSLWRDENDYLINWNQDAHDILNFVNAVSSPYRGASTYLNGQKIRILDVEIFTDVNIENRDPGKVIFVKDKHPIIVCGSGLLKLMTAIGDESKLSVIPFNNFRTQLKS